MFAYLELLDFFIVFLIFIFRLDLNHLDLRVDVDWLLFRRPRSRGRSFVVVVVIVDYNGRWDDAIGHQNL